MTVQWHSFGEVTSKLRPKNEEELPILIAVERHSRKRDQQYMKEGKKGRWKRASLSRWSIPWWARWEYSSPFLVSLWKARGLQLSNKRILSRIIKWLLRKRIFYITVSLWLIPSQIPSILSTKYFFHWKNEMVVPLPAKLLISFVLDFGKKKSCFLPLFPGCSLWFRPLLGLTVSISASSSLTSP